MKEKFTSILSLARHVNADEHYAARLVLGISRPACAGHRPMAAWLASLTNRQVINSARAFHRMEEKRMRVNFRPWQGPKGKLP